MLDYIESNKLLGHSDKVLCAVSGGADSVALLVILAELAKNDMLRLEISAMHLNHNLRDKFSDADEDFVRKLTSDMNVKLYCQSLNVRDFANSSKVSLETAGRNLRHKALMSMALTLEISKVATGHHQDDNAETVIHRMMRGTGYAGLAGIRAVKTFERENKNVDFVRPLLCLRKEEIELYLQDKKLQWRNDHTNAQTKFTRNKIRHKIIPGLQGNSDEDLVAKLSRISEKAGKFCNLVESKANKFIENNVLENNNDLISLDLPSFSNLTKPEYIEVINKVLGELGVGLRKMTKAHYDRLYETGQNNKKSSLTLPGALRVETNKGQILFIKPKNNKFDPEEIIIDMEGETKFGDFEIRTALFKAKNADFESFIRNKDRFIEWFDADKISFPISARIRRAGDRFIPMGRKSECKLSKFITSSDILRAKRKNLFVIEDKSGKFLWLVPLRRANIAQLTSKSRNILEIRVSGIKI